MINTIFRWEIKNLPNLECTEYQDEDLGVIHTMMTDLMYGLSKSTSCMSLNSTLPLDCPLLGAS